MSIKVALHHKTQYTYDREISLGPQTVRLRPAPHAKGEICSYSLKVEPKKHFLNWQQDPFGNHLARYVFPEKTNQLSIEVDLVANIKVFNPFDFFLEEQAEAFPFCYEEKLSEELTSYLELKESSRPLMDLVERFKGISKKPTVEFLVEVNDHLNKSIDYTIRMEPGVQTAQETLTLGSGSCRDLAWLLCLVFRHLGLATRFASGYLNQLKADSKSLDGPSGPESDFTDLHAWTEVYLPGAGWIGMDPTSGLFTGEGHVPLCCTPNPSSAAPISGTLDECRSTLHHEMTVQRIEEDRRVTKPYTDSEWSNIDRLGGKIDANLREHDVRLTMGGEPTFVSLDDPDDEQWNFTALGADKEKLAQDLLCRLGEKFGPGGFYHYGQGKWYPGEALPRWSKNCFWRTDHQIIWSNPDLLKNIASNQNINVDLAKDFLEILATRLGIEKNSIQSAHEDPSHSHSGGRLSAPSGFVLPLCYSVKKKGWISNTWSFESSKLILRAGDSPIGLRLPLDQLPVVENSEAENFDQSPFEKRAPLPSRDEIVRQVDNRSKATPEKFDHSPSGYVRTAICAEVRDGELCLFLPPTYSAESFLDLITTIELVAQERDQAVRLEGYEPPFDLRLSGFKVTPDPGVIEVNVQPSGSWKELVNIVHTVYQEAKESRLTTQKFMLDGRAVGTGGGNHVIVGGKTPDDSPFLRRPALLKSMVNFWQNHPSLSYLFSASFIGPTSQAPRIDEARNDSLHELEIAFYELDRLIESQKDSKQEFPLWLVDRLFRNILADLTGNTHRSELCIDKLYSPDSERGRLGLLEIRSFEMTPHPQMNLVQALLVRGLIDVFWKTPYRSKLIRWGNLLHDKFMLPYYVWQDLKDVIRFLNDHGHDFRLDWFEPFLEFRFPKYGSAHVEGLDLELRMALEPWPVLGEEVYRGATSRSVDSAVERLQLEVKGQLEERMMITCNGRRVPLKRTETPDEYVAGIRFKAWAPYSSLHPTINVQAPLTFDIIDTRYERSLGGCTYHATHPGGRNYDQLPINANEAEGRRLSRFFSSGHTVKKIKIPPVEESLDFPYTLDLRLNPNIGCK